MNTSFKYTLNKKERIKGTKRIDELFSFGESFISYPLRIVFLKKGLIDAVVPSVAMMVSVPKKKIKRAVKRNRIKRLVRESFRLNKAGFCTICEKYNIHVDIAFLYLKNELCEYQEIEKAVQKAINLLENKILPTNNNA